MLAVSTAERPEKDPAIDGCRSPIARCGWRAWPSSAAPEKFVQMRIFDVDRKMVKALDQDRR
jgi:hypothetical protein